MFVLFLFSSLTAKTETIKPKCVIDRCEDNTCIVETSEGSVEVRKKPSYTEGAMIECPT